MRGRIRPVDTAAEGRAIRDIIVIGASAGGVEACAAVVRRLPADFRAAVFVTVHFPSFSTSMLPRILSREGPLPAVHASDGEEIRQGQIYVAPPDVHLLIGQDRMRLIRGPRENGNRPAIDPMFRSAAIAHGPRVIGVVLSGNLDDGTSGLLAIKRHGGATVVQDPADATFTSMPASALKYVPVDCVVPAERIGAALVELAASTLRTQSDQRDDETTKEVRYSALDLGTIEHEEQHPGRPSGFGCPDCGGALWEMQEGDLVRYRCRVGHAWTGEALMSRQGDVLDTALWTALRTLEESASLARKLAERQRRLDHMTLAERFERSARDAEAKAHAIRRALLETPPQAVEED